MIGLFFKKNNPQKPTGPSLLSLHSDILLLIIDYLKLSDIQKLKSTCRYMQFFDPGKRIFEYRYKPKLYYFDKNYIFKGSHKQIQDHIKEYRSLEELRLIFVGHQNYDNLRDDCGHLMFINFLLVVAIMLFTELINFLFSSLLPKSTYPDNYRYFHLLNSGIYLAASLFVYVISTLAPKNLDKQLERLLTQSDLNKGLLK